MDANLEATSLAEVLRVAGGVEDEGVATPAVEDGGMAAAADDADPVGENALDRVELESILESLLLAAGTPVPLARLAQALDGPGRGEVARALDTLAERYEREGRGLRLVQVAGGFQLRTAPQHGPFVRRLLGGKPPRLSRPMLETLAIVAYRQPCTRPEIEAIRGVDCAAAMSSLLERRLVRIEGRKEAPGRPLLYATTRDFLEVFGLPDLRALPPLRELGGGAEVLADPDLTVAADGVGTTPVAAVAPPEPGVEVVAEPAAGGEPSDDGGGADEAGNDGDRVGSRQPDAERDGEGLPAGDPPHDGVGVAAASRLVS